jgi:hypothetical protein
LVETITIIGPPGSFISPGGPMNHYLGSIVSAAFFLALGHALTLPEVHTDAKAPSDDPATVDGAPADADPPADDVAVDR